MGEFWEEEQGILRGEATDTLSPIQALLVMQLAGDAPEWLEETYWDDDTGEVLEREGMLKAIREEQAAVDQHGVYTKVDVEERWERTGRGPIKTRLTNINKGDKVHPEYRARWVAMELALVVKRDDLFAATPPL